MMVALLVGALLASLFFLGRLVLILGGVYKDPVLRVSERYAVEDDLYYVLPGILLWMGVMLFSGGLILMLLTGMRFPVYLLGVALMVLAYVAEEHPEIAKEYPRLLLSYPRWYAELRQNTTREERRRIAYMWLWLPARMRLYYNSHDRAFHQWADLIIISTTMQTVEDYVDEQRVFDLY
ncbi:MAG TPA: hypothetical protein VK003_01615 [Oceanobacillus sp.]|nr:hypothetical protein [Oceanobacillus sp.]